MCSQRHPKRLKKVNGKLAIMGDMHPYIKSNDSNHQLIVKGKPFSILGAELQNSSASCPEYMSTVWPKLKSFNINTVLANVSWENIEPQEGHFDFSILDNLIAGAREHDLHLILLWFGAFKNGKSTYVPSWVKKDNKRFPRAMLRDYGGAKKVTEVLSIFCERSVEADAKAFVMFMEHLKRTDQHQSTVIMVQVENEVGLLGHTRDVCDLAVEAFVEERIPEDLIKFLIDEWNTLHPILKRNLGHHPSFPTWDTDSIYGTWRQIFGNTVQTDELFMAYHYAKYVEKVATAGKGVYPLPMFANVWQNNTNEDGDRSQSTSAGGGNLPGDYPSGGAVAHVLDI